MTRTCEFTKIPPDDFPQWTDSVPECICKLRIYVCRQTSNHKFIYASTVDTCGDPGTPTDGSTDVTSTTVGSVVTHSCNSGFVLVGAKERECLPNGTWSEPLPFCTGNL